MELNQPLRQDGAVCEPGQGDGGGGRVYALPVDLHTINQLFDATMSPDRARRFVEAQSAHDIGEARNFEEQALKMVGEKIYRTFFHGYTSKRWGVEPAALPAATLKRLPLRFSYDENYFSRRFQGIARDGYTDAIDRILDHERIELVLGSAADTNGASADHILYTGPLDRFFGYRLGRLEYRTQRFERFEYPGDFQGCAVMNYCDREVEYTRISEHRHFAPWRGAPKGNSVCFREYASACGPDDIPFYPLRLAADKELLGAYVRLAESLENVTFLGRVGTHSYLDMDVTIACALQSAEALETAWQRGQRAPVFVHAP